MDPTGRKAAIRKIISRETTDPYSRSSEPQKTQLTPENFDDWVTTNQKAFRGYVRGKYNFLDETTPKQLATEEIRRSHDRMFQNFTMGQGRNNMRPELMDTYRKDKSDEMKAIMYGWDQFWTGAQETIIQETYNKYNKIKQERNDEIIDFEQEVALREKEMREVVKLRKLDAAKYKPERILQKRKKLLKLKEELQEAKADGKEELKKTIQDEISYIEKWLGIKPDPLSDEQRAKLAKLVTQWEAESMPPEHIEKRKKQYINMVQGQ